MASISVLPSNATAYEKAITTSNDVLDRLASGVAASHGWKVFNPPASLIPWLIYEYGLGELTPYIADQSQLVALGTRWQRVRGTPDAVARGLAWLSYTAGLREAPLRRTRWNLLQLALNRVRTSEIPDLSQIEGVTQLSLPARSQFFRGFAGYDIPAGEFSRTKMSGSQFSKSSGVRIRPDGALWSFGRSYECDYSPSQSELVSLGTWIANSTTSYRWSDAIFPSSLADFSWRAPISGTRRRVMALLISQKKCWMEFRDRTNSVIGYRKCRTISLVNKSNLGPIQLGGSKYDFETIFDSATLVSPKLSSGKFELIDLVSGVRLQRQSNGENYKKTKINNLNSTGGTGLNIYWQLDSFPADTLRKSRTLNGKVGALIETQYNYLNSYSQPSVSNLSVPLNVLDDVAPNGWSGNWIFFGNNSLNRSRGSAPTLSLVSGTEYNFQFEIQMTDGSSPVLDVTGSSGDLTLYTDGVLTFKKQSDGSAGFDIEGPYLNNVYLVKCYGVSNFTGSSSVGNIQKRTTQSSKTFKIGRVNIGVGRYSPSLFDNMTSTPNARDSDKPSIAVDGFSGEEITVFAEFVCPKNTADYKIVFNLGSGFDNNILTLGFSPSSLTPQLQINSGGVLQLNSFISTALIEDKIYRFAASFSKLGGNVRYKFKGLASGSVDFLASPYVPPTIASFQFGHRNTVLQLQSLLSVAGIANRVWSDAEIASWVDAPATLVNQETKSETLYVEALTDFGDADGKIATSAALLFDAYPSDTSKPGLSWANPNELVTPLPAIAQRSVSIAFGKTVRERFETLLRITA